MFIDSCTDFIAHETIFLGVILCGTPGGAVPLGMYMTNDMTIASMALVFDALTELVGECAFDMRGKTGPISAMADEGIEIKGFIEVFPRCRRRRCCFHIFQNGSIITLSLCLKLITELRWLSAPNHGIEVEYRVEYFEAVQKMAYICSQVRLVRLMECVL